MLCSDAGSWDAKAVPGQAFRSKFAPTVTPSKKGINSPPNHLAPSFQDIANTPGMTGISLAVILHSVHENMPNFVLTPNERDNIIAYILSLKHER